MLIVPSVTKEECLMSNREYKSDVFTMLMETPEDALEIYNVLNASHYDDPAQIRIMKLEKVRLYGKKKY